MSLSPSSQPLAQAPEGFNRLKRCRNGYMLYNVNDDYIGRSLDIYGEFSEGEIEAFSLLVHPGDIVLDVGANIGSHTIWFAQAVGPTGGVMAFEPQRLLFQTLCANVALNSLKNVVCHQFAIGAEPGETAIPVVDPAMRQNFGATSIKLGQAGEPVSLVTLDELGIKKCNLIKVDVEGMELDVLKGARSLIESTQPILYVENDRKDSRGDELVRHIVSMGYDPYWHCPLLFNPGNYFKNPENVFGDTISRNMLCMPAGSHVKNLERVPVP